MSTEIVDLDELLGEDKKARLDGKIYQLPPDLPVELYLRINKAAKEGLEDADMVEKLYDELLGLFRYKQPALKELPLTMGQLVAAIGKIYAADVDEDEAVAARPTRTRGGAANSKGKTKAKSRSET